MDAFRRVFWKESRAQAHVWIALAIGVLLLQGIVVSSELVRQSQLSSGVVTALFIVTSVIGVCYAAASASILVAGEREDETAFLLRTFPIPRAALLGGKLSFTLLSLLALLLFGFVSAAFLGGLLGRDRLTLPDDLWTYTRSMGGAIVWGLLFSLLVERVMIALGLAIGTEIVVVGIIGNSLPAEWRESVYWTIVLGILTLDLVLAVRWLAGESLVPASLWKPSAAAPRVERSTSWLRLLQRIVGSGSPERRATGALLWRELRGAVPFAIVWCVVGILLVDLGMRTRDKFPAHLLFLALTPAVCGLMTALGDQRKSLFRFYADRGISPLQIWSVKIVTWLFVATTFVVFFGWYDATFTGRFDRSFGHPIGPVLSGIAESVRLPLDRMTGHVSPDAELRVWNFILSLCLMLFTTGQWAAFLRGQAVAAVALTMGLGFVALTWHFVVISADVPLLWTTWPVTLAGLAATAWNSSRWLEENYRWPTTLRRVAWFLIPIFGVLFAARTLRVTSIPAIPMAATSIPLRTSSWINYRNPQTRLLVSSHPDGGLQEEGGFRSGDTTVLWSIAQTAKSLVTPTAPSEPTPFLPTPSDRLNSIMEPGSSGAPEMEPPLPPLPTPAAGDSPPKDGGTDQPEPPATDAAASSEAKPFPKDDVGKLPEPLAAGAGPDLVAGPAAGGEAGSGPAGEGASSAPPGGAKPPEPIDPATLAARWDGLLDLIAATDRSAEGSVDWRSWIEAVETRQKVLQSARVWGRIPGQSVERLDAAIDDLRELPDCPSATQMLRNRHALWRAYASGERLSSWGPEFVPQGGAAKFLVTLMGERSRSLRLADLMTDAALRHDVRPSGDLGQIGAPENRVVAEDQARIGRWLASTFLVPHTFRFEPIASESENRSIAIHRHNAAAARLGTITCLLLQRYRLTHGEFPATLAEVVEGTSLSPERISRLTRDPFTGDEFRYRRDGFPGSVHLDFRSALWQFERTISIPAEQPLVWSGGAALRSIVPGSVIPPVYEAHPARQVDLWAPAAIGDFARTSHADQVDFLILPP